MTNTSVGQSPNQPIGGTTSGPGGGAGGASTSHQGNVDGAETSDSDDECDDERSTRSAREREFHQITYDYSRLIFNDSSRSLHVRKKPQIDEVCYSKWKNSMEEF